MGKEGKRVLCEEEIVWAMNYRKIGYFDGKGEVGGSWGRVRDRGVEYVDKDLVCGEIRTIRTFFTTNL